MNVEGRNGGMTAEDHTSAYQAFQQESSPLPASEQLVLPLLGLHQALIQAGAYEKIRNEKHRQVLQAYLTTDAPMGDLRELAGVTRPQAVKNIIHRSLQKAFPHLSQEVQAEYKSPEEAIKRKSGRLTPVSRERHKEGLANRTEVGRPKGKKDSRSRVKRADTDRPRAKKVLSATHKQHISEANFRRWQHYREQKAQSTSQEPQTIIDFTEPS
jgi:hypothetical protein